MNWYIYDEKKEWKEICAEHPQVALLELDFAFVPVIGHLGVDGVPDHTSHLRRKGSGSRQHRPLVLGRGEVEQRERIAVRLVRCATEHKQPACLGVRKGAKDYRTDCLRQRRHPCPSVCRRVILLDLVVVQVGESTMLFPKKWCTKGEWRVRERCV